MSRPRSANEIRKKRALKQKQGGVRRVLRWMGLLAMAVALGGAVGLVGLYMYFTKDLPHISSLKDYRPPTVTTVLSDDGRKIGEFFRERRIVIPLSKMPPRLIEAFVAAEDSRFYKHQGIDFLGIVRAFFKNIEAGALVQGGSTITQQVTKSFLLSPEKSFARKIKEAILAYRIDKAFTKDEILFLYLNQIYLGHGAYGVEAAAENYFGKTAADCNLAECAILAGLPQAPSRYSPFKHPEKARERQIYVLNRMVADGCITNIEATEAINTSLDIKPRRNWYIEQVPYYTEHVRRYVEEKYGADLLYTGGLTIHTAVNVEMQRAGRAALEKGVMDLDKRQGYRGPLQHLPSEQMESFCSAVQEELDQDPLDTGKTTKGLVVSVDDKAETVTVRIGKSVGSLPLSEMLWARRPDPEVEYYAAKVRRPSQVLSVGDVILVRIKGKEEETEKWRLVLEQVPSVQGAIICLETETGQVKAMLGGRDFGTSQFNRAIQSRRQPGSAFKPIIYSAALDKGYTPATIIIDSPIVLSGSDSDALWKPKNYEGRFHGPTLFRDALALSRNVVTIKILKDIGIDYVITYAGKLQITSPLAHNLSIALGSSGVSLLELVTAYSVFANQGVLVPPSFITRILDRDGNVLEEQRPGPEKVIDKATAFIMTNLLQGVVEHGTGRRIRALNRPAAGKTGTTNDLFDAWFVGYTPRYVTGVWVGFDEEAPLGKGETGARAASPIWLSFMQEILKDKPVRVFPVPDGVVFAKIDAETGLLAIPESKKTVFECFKEGTAPVEYTKKPDAVSEPGRLFKSDM